MKDLPSHRAGLANAALAARQRPRHMLLAT
jgi:hypothetical protein